MLSKVCTPIRSITARTANVVGSSCWLLLSTIQNFPGASLHTPHRSFSSKAELSQIHQVRSAYFKHNKLEIPRSFGSRRVTQHELNYHSYAYSRFLPGAKMVLLWAMDDRPKRSITSKINYSFSELSGTINDFEQTKKHPRILKKLKRVENTIRTYTANYPEIAEGFAAWSDEQLTRGSYYLCDKDLKTLAESVLKWRKSIDHFTGFRSQYPFETHIIEHAEELVPGLLPYMSQQLD